MAIFRLALDLFLGFSPLETSDLETPFFHQKRVFQVTCWNSVQSGKITSRVRFYKGFWGPKRGVNTQISHLNRGVHLSPLPGSTFGAKKAYVLGSMAFYRADLNVQFWGHILFANR